MQHFELKGQVRQVGNKAVVKAYRKQGVVPCNLYGLGMENILFTVDEKELKALTNTPKSYIVDL
ncbi:MAG: 50S ribosomal protein L25, partial [Bacteroidales bacterium]|nr:50S ribosomal protein L25 [Bacteroidales bacterium]